MPRLPTLSQKRGSGMGEFITPDDLEQTIDGDWVRKKHKTPVFILEDELRERIHRKVWRTKDGREVPISEMDKLHLMRTINLIKRKAHHEHPATKEYIRLMQAELHRRDPLAFAAP